MNAALAGLAIMVLGDSHMAGPNYLISSLHDSLAAQGAHVDTFGMCGASPDAWLERTTVSCGRAERHGDQSAQAENNGKQEYTWQINDLLNKYHPNLVIIEAADAMGGYGSPTLPKAWIYEQSHALAMRIKASGASCIWVGPVYGDVNSPYHKADDRVRELSEFLSQSVAPCTYVDSLKFEQSREWPTTDGQHLTTAGYKTWGSDIANAAVQLKQQNQLK